nr:sulfurtransferase TusA family protein [Caulobacter hibisci]
MKLRKALEQAPGGATVRLLADDPMARIDVPHFARQLGATLEGVEDLPSGVISFRVTKAP